MDETLTCAQESRMLGESLAGSFKPADIFFLIENAAREYGGWQNSIVKKVQQSGDFAPCLRHLMTVPRAKTLFIRRPQSQEKNFYIALTHQPQPKIYHSQLSAYEDLLELDLASVAADRTPCLRGHEMSEIDELYAVCTNGRHDPCCAAYGRPVYEAMAAQVGMDKVWQTTHIGGHRLAATMIVFPHGIAYGQLDPSHAEEIAVSHRSGCLLLPKYRGRGAYAGHSLDEDVHCAVEAAEAHVRGQTQNDALNGLDLIDVSPAASQQWRVRFADGDGRIHQAQVTQSMSSPRLTSCQEAPKPMPLHQVANGGAR